MGKSDNTLRRGLDSLGGHLGEIAGGAAAGAAIGAGVSLAWPALATGAGIAVGAFVGPIVVDRVARIWPSAYGLHSIKRFRMVDGRPRWLSYAEWLFIDKLRRDFSEPHLPGHVEIDEAGREILRNATCLGIIPARFRNDIDDVAHLVPKLDQKTVVPRPAGAIQRLRRRAKHLSIACISVHPAVIATLIHMRDGLKIPLSLNGDYEYGLLAIKNIISSMVASAPYDIIFLPDSAFLMAHDRTLPVDFTIDYRFMLPVSSQHQYIVRRRSKRPQVGLNGVNFTRFLRNSTGHGQFHQIRREVDIPLKDHPYDIENRLDILADVEDNVAVALWDPTHLYAIASGEFYEVEELRRKYWLSMYGLRSVFSDKKTSTDLIAAFIYSWNYCGLNLSYASDLLEREASIKSGFQRGIHSFDRKSR